MTFFTVCASVASGLGPGRGPALRYSDPRAFARVKRSRSGVRAFLDWARDHAPLSEALVWNTCQRLECYGWLPRGGDDDLVPRIRRELFGNEHNGLAVNVLTGLDAWHHLARTACGLNSELPGDLDVAAQLQTACRLAQCAGIAGPRTTTLVEDAVALAYEVHRHTTWGRFSSGYCEAAVARLFEEDGIQPAALRHVVIGGSTTSRSVLSTLWMHHRVPQQRLTLVHRDHHGQMKQLRAALGTGTRLRVRSYDAAPVLRAVADADCVFFGIDRADPVTDGAVLSGLRNFAARPLTIVDFNSFGSVARGTRLAGIRLWTAKDLDRAVAAHAAVTVSRPGFARAVGEAEEWIVRACTSPAVVTSDPAAAIAHGATDD